MEMKLLSVIASMDPVTGGPCQGLRNSIPEWEKIGIHVEVVSLDDPDAPFMDKDPFVIHALGKGKGPWNYHPNLMPWLLQNLDSYDKVIIHGLWLYHGYATRKALELYRKQHGHTLKYFVRTHGMLDPWFQRAKGREWKAIRNWFYWKLIEKNVVNESEGVLFTCEEELRLAREPFRPYQPKREINVGYGILPPPMYHPEMEKAFKTQCPTLGDSPYLLFLSRIHVKKGVDLLVKVYLKLKSQGFTLPKLVISGPGLDTPYGQQMMELASNEKDILFPGMLSGDAKWGALYGCEAFILPSHQENFGIAVVEALACGKPVLISNQVNIWREIEKEEAGIIAPDTEVGVQKQIEQWIGISKEERKVMQQRTIMTVSKHFSVVEAAKKMKAALEI